MRGLRIRLPRPRRFVAPLGLLAGLTVTLVVASASAQDLPAPPPPPPPSLPPPSPAAVPAPPPPPAELDDLRFRDANADRVILGSTAETHPKGTLFFSDYEILLLQVGYAITDEFQLSLTGVPPIIQNQPYYFDFGAKLNLLRSESFRAALTGGFEIVTTGGSGSSGPYFGGRIAGIGQICFNVTCRSSLSLNLGTILTSGVNEVLPVYGSTGFIVNLSRLVSLLAEPALLGALGTGAANIGSGAFFAFDYGVRISGANFGVDLTFLEPVAATTGGFSNPFILGYPFVAMTYRTDGDARSPETHAGNMRQRGF